LIQYSTNNDKRSRTTGIRAGNLKRLTDTRNSNRDKN
jgi:hypothetical protein